VRKREVVDARKKTMLLEGRTKEKEKDRETRRITVVQKEGVVVGRPRRGGF